MDGGAWQAAVHGVAKSRTRLSNFAFTFHFHALEKEMATHSSVLAWRIPGTGEPGGLPSMGCIELDTTEATQQQQQAFSVILFSLLVYQLYFFLKLSSQLPQNLQYTFTANKSLHSNNTLLLHDCFMGNASIIPFNRIFQFPPSYLLSYCCQLILLIHKL